MGEAATGEEAVALARRFRPDVLLIDAKLPGLDPIEATGVVVAETGAHVMLLTASERDDRIFAALRAGASGVLVRDTEPTELVRAVDTLARGEALLSPSLARRVIAELASRPVPECPSPELLDDLTAREREVVALVALGLSNDGIAERLVVSRATAKTHVSRAMVKLDARDRGKLVVFAYEAGLVVPRSRDACRGHPAGRRPQGRLETAHAGAGRVEYRTGVSPKRAACGRTTDAHQPTSANLESRTHHSRARMTESDDIIYTAKRTSRAAGPTPRPDLGWGRRSRSTHTEGDRRARYQSAVRR